MSQETLKDVAVAIKAEKESISNLISKDLLKTDLTSNKGRQKSQELIDVAKFILASKENIKILESEFEKPDFLIEWDNVKFGLEHTEVIDQSKKDTFEKTQGLIKEAEKIFLERYGDISVRINFSLKFEVKKIKKREKQKLLNKLLLDYKNLNWEPQKLMNTAYPGLLTEEDITIVAGELADMAYITYINNEEDIANDLVHYISVWPSKTLLFTRTVGWSAGTLNDLLIKSIEEKEAKIDKYIQNTNGLKQCLFLLIQGSNGYSDYASFNDGILKERGSKFDKVVVFNFFKKEFFILK